MNEERTGRPKSWAGYSLQQVYTLERTLRQAHAEDEELPEGEAELNLIWDWRIPDIESIVEGISESEGVPDFFFEIALGVELSPSQERPERGRTILIGRFPFDAKDHSVPLLQFVQLHGVATLYPYLRQAVSDLTELSFHGPLYLPILNVSGLMEGFDLEPTTGWDQLSRHRKLAEDLGIKIPGSEEESETAQEETLED